MCLISIGCRKTGKLFVFFFILSYIIFMALAQIPSYYTAVSKTAFSNVKIQCWGHKILGLLFYLGFRSSYNLCWKRGSNKSLSVIGLFWHIPGNYKTLYKSNSFDCVHRHLFVISQLLKFGKNRLWLEENILLCEVKY